MLAFDTMTMIPPVLFMATVIWQRIACWEGNSAEGNTVSNAWLDLERGERRGGCSSAVGKLKSNEGLNAFGSEPSILRERSLDDKHILHSRHCTLI